MTDWTNDDDLNEILGVTDGNNDNSTIKVLRAKIKADAEAMKALQKEVANLNETRKATVVGDVLKSAGINPKVAKFYQGEADPTAVQAWVQENADVFGVGQTTSDDGSAPNDGMGQLRQNAITVPPILPESQQVDYTRMLNAGVDGIPPSNYNDIMGALTGAANEEDFMAAMRRFQ
jgi:hypothetical protein